MMYYIFETNKGVEFSEPGETLNGAFIRLDWEDVVVYNYHAVAEMALCKSRHEIRQAVDGSIFSQEIENPMDFIDLLREAKKVLAPMYAEGVRALDLYVTGLTPALLETLNAARELGVRVVTYHHDKDTGRYLPLSIN